MRVIVTGSNGFIGRHVCRYLMDRGMEVVGLGRSEKPLYDCDDYIQCDIGTDAVFGILDKLGKPVDAVVHLAADMRHEPYTVDVVETNCGGTQRLLELCEGNGIPTFVQLSSLPVIGTPIIHPIDESHPLKPPTVYHVTKHAEEMLADYAFYTFGLRTVSFRICSPIGEGVNPRTIFPVFVRSALKGEDIVLLGDGSRKQTYIHVDDISQAIYLALTVDVQGVYNLASENLVSNYELAQRCVELLDSKSVISFEGEDLNDGVVWDVSIEKIKDDMGFEPVRDLNYMIEDLADSCRKELG